jgi:glycosyltransferase involved in cell wall biosynthesis
VEPISVIIPAHNEADVIGRCLSGILDGADHDELDVVVVPNGCTDATAEIAATFGPPVRVVVSPVASKAAALNVGDRAASTFPRFYVDADVEIDIASIRAVGDVLRSGEADVAAPRIRVVLTGRSWAVRAYYSIWLQLPYHSEDMVGSGVYALSQAGRESFDEFPQQIADDGFIRTVAPRDRRRSVSGAEFTVHPPLDLASLHRVRRRVYTGNVTTVSDGAGVDPDESRRQRAALAALARSPRRWPALGVYLGVASTSKLASRWRARRPDSGGWDRDDSARHAAREMPG